jgi:surface protein
MANSINWGKIYESTYWGSGVADNTINWGKSYRDLAGDPALFITEWQTDTDGETITIPIITNNTYTITTSDGQEITTNGGSTTIEFPIAGTHEVSISGNVQQIFFNDTGDKNKILDIKQWGTDTTWISFSGAFRGCENLDVTAPDTPKLRTAYLVVMSSIFKDCINLIGTPAFNNWDVSNVNNMFAAFNGATNFNQNISNWDVSNVTNMGSMFRNSVFNQDIGNWDVSSVENMGSLFRNSPFDQDISSWNIISATNLNNFLLDGTLSTSNYDALLIGWAAQSVQSNITIDFGNSQYTAGGAAEAARNTLTTTYGWIITDGGSV